MREIRVASIQPLQQFRIWSYDQPDRAGADELREKNLALAERLLTRAGEAGCDIVCYPEDLEGIGGYLFRPDLTMFNEMVGTAPGAVTERIGGLARKYHMHIICSQYERVEGKIYNAAVLLGREGEILGKYHKVQMPAVERWTVTPGDSFPVFQTDFGTVGILVCYDMEFPEVTRSLVLNGAEVLFCPTMGVSTRGMIAGNGLIRMQARAMENYVPIVISTCRAETMIVNSDGGLLAMARPGAEDVIFATIDLDGTPVEHSEWEFLTGTSDVKARHLQERLPQVFTTLTDPRPPVLERFRDKPLRPAPEDRESLFAERTRWWAEHRPEG